MIVDFHAHVLPGMDSGCPSRIVAIRQMLMAKHANVDVIVAAPEFDPAKMPVREFLEKREICAQHLETVLQSGMPRVVLGAEVLWHAGLEGLEELERLCVGTSGQLLLRMPEGGIDTVMADSVERLCGRLENGVLLANAEHLEPEQAAMLYRCGAHGELSFSALEHRGDREKYVPWIQNGFVTALGSNLRGDAHAYRKLRKIQHRLDGLFEPLMILSAGMLGLNTASSIAAV